MGSLNPIIPDALGRLNQTHGLAKGLQSAIRFDARGKPVDLVNPRRTLTFTNFSYDGTGANGPSFLAGGTNGALALSPTVLVTNSAWTISALCRFPIDNNAFAAFARGSSQLHVCRDNANDALATFDSASRAFSPTIAIRTLTGMKRLTVVGTSLGCRAFLDGVFVGSHAFPINQAISDILGDHSDVRAWGAAKDAFVWNASLSDGQVMEHALDPFAMFQDETPFTWLSVPLGIAFDVAGNSGDQAAASSYSGAASWNGANRMLAVDVSMLGPGVTVTTMTYGGANCTFVGAQSTVTSFGRVEQWRICSSDAGAPAAGSNTLAITLSGSLEFAAEWASYTGVHQTSPTEGFNSAQATNAGSATDASVAITSVADNCWVHAAVVANDTSIAAGQTTRNNIAGTLGSGANEDNNAAVTPAGATTMSYTGMSITTTWAIAGYAIRPLAASGANRPVKSAGRWNGYAGRSGGFVG